MSNGDPEVWRMDADEYANYLVNHPELFSLKKCPYTQPCCFNRDGKCTILRDTKFKDGQCHFRKLVFNGENQYDINRKQRKIPG